MTFRFNHIGGQGTVGEGGGGRTVDLNKEQFEQSCVVIELAQERSWRGSRVRRDFFILILF